MEYPMSRPEDKGTQKDIHGKEVQPNQKKEAANRGPAMSAISRRCSGGTGLGANRAASFWYKGL